MPRLSEIFLIHLIYTYYLVLKFIYTKHSLLKKVNETKAPVYNLYITNVTMLRFVPLEQPNRIFTRELCSSHILYYINSTI